MTFLALSALVALALSPQASPQPANGGTGSTGGVQGSGAAGSRGAHDLAGILQWIQSRSGGQQGSGGRFSPPGGTNVRVSAPSPKAQWMPAIAVDPTDRLHLIGAGRDDRTYPGYHSTVLYSSFDGGQSWSALFHGALGNQDFRDPAVAFGASGEVYCVVNWPFGPGSANYIGPSFDGGLTVPNWYHVDGAGDYNDQPAIAVDRTTGPYAGNVYVASDWFTPEEFPPSLVGVGVATSSDGGQTSKAVNIRDTIVGDKSSRPSIAVDTAGVVHVVWYDFGLQTISSDQSADGGATWGTDVPIAATAPFSIPHFANQVSPRPSSPSTRAAAPSAGRST